MMGTILRVGGEPSKARAGSRMLFLAGIWCRSSKRSECRHRPRSATSAIIACFGSTYGTYTGIGYLTGRSLSFRSDIRPVVVDDDTKNLSLQKDSGRIMTNIGSILAREVLDSEAIRL
jgi:hypothetical protein